MPKIIAYASIAAILLFISLPVKAATGIEIGKPAPEIEATDTNGNAFKLSDHKGKIVVLEWTNHECPFVVKHYGSGNMQSIQKTVKDKNVEWVSIVSSAPGRQGHINTEKANMLTNSNGSSISAKILDESGAIGKLYDAKTTPHMFVIDTDGNIAYAGAIDDNSSPNPAVIKTSKNYVLAAIDDLQAGHSVTTAQTQPYGCSVKY